MPKKSFLKEARRSARLEMISVGKMAAALYPILGRGAIVFEEGQPIWYLTADKSRDEVKTDDAIATYELIEKYDPEATFVLIEAKPQRAIAMSLPLHDVTYQFEVKEGEFKTRILQLSQENGKQNALFRLAAMARWEKELAGIDEKLPTVTLTGGAGNLPPQEAQVADQE